MRLRRKGRHIHLKSSIKLTCTIWLPLVPQAHKATDVSGDSPPALHRLHGQFCKFQPLEKSSVLIKK